MKIFLFIFSLFFDAVVINTQNCDNWFLEFPTKYHCLEHLRSLSTTEIKTTTTTVRMTTTTKVISTTTTESIDKKTSVTPTITAVAISETNDGNLNTTTMSFVPTIQQPTFAPPLNFPESDSDSTTTLMETTTEITSISTTSTTTTTISNVTSSAKRMPWWGNIWGILLYW